MEVDDTAIATTTAMTASPLAMRLNGDAFAEIAAWLDSRALCTLVFCGDRSLSAKLARHVRAVTHRCNARRAFAWPFYIRGWTGLKHLSIHPGESIDLYSLRYESDEGMRLVARVVESLPRSLETLHLEGFPLSLEKAFRNTQGRSRTLNDNFTHVILGSSSNHSDRPRQYRDYATPSRKAETMTASSDDGILANLHRHLPQLRHFSFAPNYAMMTYTPAMTWTEGATHMPLTHLSLSNLVLLRMSGAPSPPLCVMFQSLPRTLLDLELGIDNCGQSELPGTWIPPLLLKDNLDDANAWIAASLPPNLTRLKLGLHIITYMPSNLLSNLSYLHTLKLSAIDMREMMAIDTDPSIYEQGAAHLRALSCLPASVTKLSMNGFNVDDLQHYVASIPNEHCALRHLTIKAMRLPETASDFSSFPFLRTITSHTKFRQLESLHGFSELLSPSFVSVINDHHFHHPLGDHANVPDEEGAYEGMASMIHLRSVSAFFLCARFSAFWRHVAPYLTVDSPMHLHLGKYLPVCSDKFWDVMRRLGMSTTSHIIIDGGCLLLTDSVEWLYHNGCGDWTAYPSYAFPGFSHAHLDWLMKNRNYVQDNNPDNESDNEGGKYRLDVSTMIASVKSLVLSLPDEMSSRKEIQALSRWPHALESLKLMFDSGVTMTQPELDLSAPSMRALRTLCIEISVDMSSINDWMRSLPDTLEVLHLSCVKKTRRNPHNGRHEVVASPPDLLTYIPPRMRILELFSGFAIGAETFDAMPSSLEVIDWREVKGVFCNAASDLTRWPLRARCVTVRMSFHAVVSLVESESDEHLVHWWKHAKYLEKAHIYYKTRNGHAVDFQRDLDAGDKIC